MRKTKVLLIAAKVFSGVGGIEQVNRTWIYALNKSTQHDLTAFSLQDFEADDNYIEPQKFNGFRSNKLLFLFHYFKKALQSDTIVITHIHLGILVPILKKIKPKLKIIILCHGIEVWDSLPSLRLQALKGCDLLLAVSEFTRQKLISIHGISQSVKVLNNCLHPFFEIPKVSIETNFLINKYQLPADATVLLTISRLSYGEQYKGYDQMILAMPHLLHHYPNIFYLIGGKGDIQELDRLNQLIIRHQLTNIVKLVGFIHEEELSLHYQSADVFVMPSRGEGFGISFIEAGACGTPSLGGNLDGSIDAIIHGVTGFTCDPNDKDAIAEHINELLKNKMDRSVIQERTLNRYSYPVYEKKIYELI